MIFLNVFSEKYKEVLERIMNLKTEKGLSDLSLERELGIKKKTIDSWKRGNSKSFLKMIPEIADYFNVSADYLLGVTSTRNKFLDNDNISENNIGKSNLTEDKIQNNEPIILTEDKAVSMIQQSLIDAKIVEPGQTLTDAQLLVLTEFITNNSTMLKKLMDR